MLNNFDIMNLEDPYSFYAWARVNQSFFFDYKSGYWIVTKYNDIKKILNNEIDFSAELERTNFSKFPNDVKKVLRPINFEDLYGLSTTENPDHDRIKRVLMPIFNSLFNSLISPIIEDITKQYIEKINSLTSFDIVKELFYGLPADIIFKILGIPRDHVSKIKTWTKSRLELTWGDASNQLLNANNIVNFWEYCKNLIDDKIKKPDQDLPSELAKYIYTNELTKHDIYLLCYGLIFSGHMTTTAFLTESLKQLLQSGKWNEFVNQKITVSETADELLRYCPSVLTRRRLVKNEVLINNQLLKPGDKLLLSIGSANRDEDVFQNPDEINFNRKNSSRHLTFGNGFHYCIGAKLVKLEYTVIMNSILSNFPDIKLSDSNTYSYSNNISIRSINNLLVTIY